MGKLVRFADSSSQRWSRVDLENGDPIWISIAQTGVLVKRSDLGLFGATLFRESNLYDIALTAMRLNEKTPHYATPPEMTDAVLRAFTQTALDCATAAELSIKLNETFREARA